jgi:hypothetical protein
MRDTKYYLERVRQVLNAPPHNCDSTTHFICQILEHLLEDRVPMEEVDEDPPTWQLICQVCGSMSIETSMDRRRCEKCNGPVWYYECSGRQNLGSDSCCE